MANIKKLKANGQDIVPITHEQAVLDSNGVTLESKLNAINNTISQLENNSLGVPSIIISVKDFGAIGDGTTDDSDALNLCFDYAKQNNCIVSLDYGTYYCSNDLRIDNIKVVYGNIRLANDKLLNLLNTSNLSFVNIIGDCDFVNTNKSSLYNCTIRGRVRCTTKAINSTIEKCTIYCAYYGILWNDDGYRVFDDIEYTESIGEGLYIKDCTFFVTSSKQAGDIIEVNAPNHRFSDIYISNCIAKFDDGVVNGGSATIGAIGFGFAQCDNLHIENNHIYDVSNSNGMIHVEWCTNFHINNNILINCDGNSIVTFASTDGFICNNYIENCTTGINLISNLSLQKNIQIKNNTIKNYKYRGIIGAGLRNIVINDNNIIDPLLDSNISNSCIALMFYINSYGSIKHSQIKDNIFSKGSYAGTFNLPINIATDSSNGHGINNIIINNECIDEIINYYDVDANYNYVSLRIGKAYGSFNIASYPNDTSISVAYYGLPCSNDKDMVIDINKGIFLKSNSNGSWTEHTLGNTNDSLNNIVTPEKTSFFIADINLGLIDIKSYQFDKAMNQGNEVSANKYALTGEIPIDASKTYILSSTKGSIYAMAYFFDSNKTYLFGSEITTGTITPVENASILRIALYNYSDHYQYTSLIESDKTISDYATYKLDPIYYDYDIIKSNLGIISNGPASWYQGKKVTCFGDSITAQATWIYQLYDYFGLSSIVNCGIGGTTVSNNGSMIQDENGNSVESWMCSDYRISTIPSDSDVILIFGGHNDWCTEVEGFTIGELNSSFTLSDSTYMGAYALMIKKLITNFPNAKLIGLTPVGGRTNTNANQDNQMYLKNGCMYDFAEATKKVLAYYGIPCIDVHAESGINTFNHTTYVTDLIHPNAIGGNLIANCVINGMKRFEPIDF